MDSEQAIKLNKLRWGDKLTCRLTDRKGLRHAECRFNGELFEGRGKDNASALKAVFKKIDGMGKR